MPEYLSPGVYIEELAGPKPIEGVGTSTGAFVGIAERGPINDPQLITNMTQFADTFGTFQPDAFLAHAVRHFFTEGGTRCYVIRAFSPTPITLTETRPDQARAVFGTAATGGGTVVMTVFASSPGIWGRNVSVLTEAVDFNPDAANDPRFKLSVFLRGVVAPVEVFDQLSMNEFLGTAANPIPLPNPNHVSARINGNSKYIIVIDATTSPTQIAPPFFERQTLALGANGVALVPNDLIGGPGTATARATGLFAFDAVDNINIVAIPDLMNGRFPPPPATAARDATIDAIGYCDRRKDCFFIIDTPPRLSPQQALGYKRGDVNSPVAGGGFNSKFAALYYPWIFTTDPATGNRMLVPPSGAVAGSYAESDGRVGVHKAPAGTEDGYLNSAVEVERVITKGEQDTLNPNGVNVIRKFADAGIVIWGARTVSADPEWKYVNVRRLFNFLEQSILKGTQGLVFEPNDPSLWKRITRDVSAFLRVQWMEGKIIGNKPEQAFFVHCNEQTNTPETMDLGEVITLIGVCPSKPAEFVIFRIKQTRFGGDVTD
jgi:phage tail sheath protein FI